MSELREAIVEAMKSGTEENEQVEVPEADAPEVEAPDVDAPEVEEKPESEERKETKEAKEAKDGRDEKGRFAAKQNAEAEAKTAQLAGKPVPAPTQLAAKPTPQVAATRPPQSWTPAAREEWAKVPASVQAEIAKRERETSVAIQQGAETRRFAQEFGQVIRPYEGMIAASGSNPLQSVSRLLQTAAALRTEPGPMKARIVADLVKTYGISIDDLATAIDGGAPAQGQQQPAQYRDPRVDQMLAQQDNERQRRAQASQQQVATSVQAFATDPKNEFFNDVQSDMAKMVSAGLASNLKEAYDRACSLHPEVNKVLQQRQAAAKPSVGSTQRSRAAASSVRSTPTANIKTAHSDDIRSTIRAAIVANSER